MSASPRAGVGLRRRQRVALGGGLLQPALELDGPQLEHLDGLQRLRGGARLGLLGGLGAARAPLGQHGVVDDLAAGLVGLLRALGRSRHARRLDAPGQRRQAGAGAARPLDPHRLGVGRHELGGHQVRAAPGVRVAGEASVGERVEPVLGPVHPQRQRR